MSRPLDHAAVNRRATARRSGSTPPTDAQMAEVRRLMALRGKTLRRPVATSREASRLIDALRTTRGA